VDLGERFGEDDLTVAVAESLTGGLLSSRLARMEGASQWFRGGLVAYASDVKRSLLAVPPGPVVSESAVLHMAKEATRLFGADFAVAVSGVGGPEPQDGLPPGTVWIGVHGPHGATAHLHRFDGDPPTVCDRTCDAALDLLAAAARASS